MAAPDGFKLTLLGVAGQGAVTAAPHDFGIVSTVPSAVLKDLFLERLNSLVALGVMSPEQVQAFKQLLTDVENGNLPEAPQPKIAALSIARKLARRCYHTLRSLDPEVVYAMPWTTHSIFVTSTETDRPPRTSGTRGR